ncbi:MAG: hypothetical protein OEY74_06160 [Gammaproteobacteria bacterium]|nr:hypothetical protein [Gammaproteobacteria bacterium]
MTTVAVVRGQLAQNRDVTLATYHKYALPRLRVSLHDGIHAEVTMPPAGRRVGSHEIVVLADEIGIVPASRSPGSMPRVLGRFELLSARAHLAGGEPSSVRISTGRGP